MKRTTREAEGQWARRSVQQLLQGIAYTLALQAGDMAKRAEKLERGANQRMEASRALLER